MKGLKLWQKGLVFILLPVLIELLIFANYSQLLNNAEFVASEEYHSKSIIGRCHWISVLVLSTTLGLCSYVVTGEEKQLGAFKHGVEVLPAELVELTKVVNDNPRQTVSVKKGSSLIEDLLSRLRRCYEARRAGDSSRALKDMSEIARLSVWSDLVRVRHDLLSSENNRYNLGTDLLPRIRNQQRVSITAMLAVNVLAAAAMFLAFTGQITSRLSILSDNVLRFTKKENLNPPISGQDEVTKLDSAFHDMANALQEAESRKQEYIQMLSHDLRTPLSSIVGCLSIMSLPDYGLNDRGAEVLHRAERNAQTVLDLVNELLEIERTEAGAIVLEYRVFDVALLLAQVVDAISPLAQKQGINIDYPRQEQYIHADEGRLERVLTNLLGNALKFSLPDSKITISTTETSDWVEIKIKDQGVGIPPDFIDKVFDRFQQVRSEDSTVKGGTGLGLAICKAIVEAHHGKIGVNSQVGVGSEFWLRIPLPPEEEDGDYDAPTLKS